MSTSLHDENVLHFLSDLPLTLSPEHDIRGKQVHDSDGKPIGTIREFVVSHDNGRVVFVEVECKTLFGSRKHLIPVEHLVMKAGSTIAIRGGNDLAGETPWQCPDLKTPPTAA
ncbi:MAG: PRC-barrel domain-containing protein [Capsulimonadaceae bacterium]|nr:PRC-barrel domain-containing protein [Capsulimonadaceae bacterium]